MSRCGHVRRFHESIAPAAAARFYAIETPATISELGRRCFIFAVSFHLPRQPLYRRRLPELEAESTHHASDAFSISSSLMPGHQPRYAARQAAVELRAASRRQHCHGWLQPPPRRRVSAGECSRQPGGADTPRILGRFVKARTAAAAMMITSRRRGWSRIYEPYAIAGGQPPWRPRPGHAPFYASQRHEPRHAPPQRTIARATMLS